MEDELFDEVGQGVLFGGELYYEAPEGHGEGQGQLSSMSQDWYTHSEIVERTRGLFGGRIDLDPMSCEEANRVVQANVYYTAEQDGLIHPWYGSMLWNPPWGGSDASSCKQRGVKKLIGAFNDGYVRECICVLNANALTTRWFSPLLQFPVCVPSFRIPHYGPDGKGGAPNSGTVIVYVGTDTTRFQRYFSDLGRIMMPVIDEVSSDESAS
jgi:hypothetical protein